MQTSTFVSGLLTLGLALAGAWDNTTAPTTEPTGASVTVVTMTTDVYTTFCPEATKITTNGKTYTATASETITITDCPCQYKHTTTLPPAKSPTAAPPANGTVVWTTETVSSYTTFCPASTQITQGSKTYTVTAPTTLTITDCPCTISRPVTTAVATPYQNATILYTTETVPTITVACPTGSTTVITGGKTYPVTAPTTLTISEGCPCTTVRPVSTMPVAPPVVGKTSAPAGNSPVAPTGPAASTRASIAVGGATSFGSSVAAWLAAAALAVVA